LFERILFFGEILAYFTKFGPRKNTRFFCGDASILTLFSKEYNIFLQDEKCTSRFGPRCYNKKVSGWVGDFWNNGWGKTSAHF
jgi:hypothetical protein